MSLAKKLREVVAANFVEIARPDKDTTETAKESESSTTTPAGTGWDAVPAVGRLEDEDDLRTTVATQAGGLGDLAASGERDTITTAVAEATAEAVGEEGAETAPEPDDATLIELAAAADPLSLIGEDGSVDFETVYLREAVPRSATFTAEQALNMLLTMPTDLSLRVKRLTVKTTLDAVGQAVGATPADIVADAERKKSGLENYIGEIISRTEEIRAQKEEEIAQLKAVIADIEVSISQAEKRKNEAISVTRNRMDQFDQVVAFFTASEGEAAAAQEEEHEEEGELPSFLQDDTVMRLLGINGAGHENGSSEESGPMKSATPAESAV